MELASEIQGEVIDVQAEETSPVLREQQWGIPLPVTGLHRKYKHTPGERISLRFQPSQGKPVPDYTGDY